MSRRQPEGQCPAAGSTLQVFCLRGVCVCCTLLCVLLLPELGDAARPRCGVELVADLEFVCGDRGFYRGRARSGGSRSRGKGIVEQCCLKGCDLQHLEQYCAKPSRGRRQAPAAPLRTREFQVLIMRQYRRFLELDPKKLPWGVQELDPKKLSRGVQELKPQKLPRGVQKLNPQKLPRGLLERSLERELRNPVPLHSNETILKPVERSSL